MPADRAEPDPTLVDRLRAAGCVFAEDEARLLTEAADTPDHLARLVARRVGGEPLEPLLGWVEFCGLRVGIDPGVFVPRRRTGLLVREAVRLGRRGALVVDLCCGCGAIGLAVAAGLDGVRLVAADIDPVSTQCARGNIGPFGGRVYDGDLYDALPTDLRGDVDLLLVNAPYVPTEQIAFMPTEARDYEPRAALDGGLDGLDLHRRVAAVAPDWLRPNGFLLLESSVPQAGATAQAMTEAGLIPRIVHDDEIGGTVVIGSRAEALRGGVS